MKGFNSLNEHNVDNKTALQYTCENNNIKLVRLLLKQKNIIVPKYVKYKNKKIKSLLNSYKKDPSMTCLNLMLEDTIDIYRHIIFLQDGYFNIVI